MSHREDTFIPSPVAGDPPRQPPCPFTGPRYLPTPFSTECAAQALHMGLADFQHYANKHRPLTAPRIIGYVVVDRPSENQLLALARKQFAKYEQMGGVSSDA